MRSMAERLDISTGTLQRLEKGDPGVSIGLVAKALSVLGVQGRLGQVIEPATDSVGQTLELSRLPKAVRATTTSDLDF